jgi:hypothetical protein
MDTTSKTHFLIRFAFMPRYHPLHTFQILFRHEVSRNHYISTNLAHYSSSFEAGEQVLLSPNDAKVICHAHGFSVETGLKGKRKVYDLTLISTELDWLEIRLHTLSLYVDYFVVIKSPTTFTGKQTWAQYIVLTILIIH